MIRRLVSITVVVAVASLTLVGCGGGDDAPTVSNTAPFVGEKFTVSGSVDTDGARPVALEAFVEGWSQIAKAKTTADGDYTFTTSLDEPSMRYRVVAPAKGELERHVTAAVKVATVEDEVHLAVVRGPAGRLCHRRVEGPQGRTGVRAAVARRLQVEEAG